MSDAPVAIRLSTMVAAVLTFGLVAPAVGGGFEVRVSSGDRAGRTRIVLPGREGVVVRGEDGRPIADDTPSQVFLTELRLALDPLADARQASIRVEDALVSALRLSPGEEGGTLTIFVRQPVTFRIVRTTDPGGLEIRLAAAPAEEPSPPGPRQRTSIGALDEGGVSLDAETLSYDRDAEAVMARGGVTLRRGDTTLQADEVRYERRTARATATGNVTLLDPELTLLGSYAELDLDDETGWLTAGHAEFQDSRFVLDADRVEKRGGPHYHVRDGVFTTCRCGGLERPSWSLACDETDVTLGSFGRVRGATFRVKDVPLLYVPFLAFPATTERQTGLLMPRVGYSSRRGFQLEQPFFWAIDKSSDLTLAFDLETEARVGLIGEYRYRWSREAGGALAAAVFDESLRTDQLSTRETPDGVDPEAPEQRFAIAGRHDQPGPFGSDLYMDLFAVGDDLFLREINNFSSSVESDLRIRSTRFTRSRAGGIRTWDRGLVHVEARYYQDLIDPQELALQALPRVQAEHTVPLLGDRVLGRLRGDVVDFVREDGADGFRFELAPELVVPMRFGRYLNGSVRGIAREQAFVLGSSRQVALVTPDDEDLRARFRVASPRRIPRLDRTHSRETAEVRARLGTRLARTFDFAHLGMTRLRHTVEPEVRFVYVPPVGREDATFRLPECEPGQATRERQGYCNGLLSTAGYLFDEADAINRRTFLAYGLTTRLYGRFEGTPPAGAGDEVAPREAPRELLQAEILHGVDATRDITDGRRASDVDLGLRLTPTPYLGVAWKATVDVEGTQLLAQSIGAFVREPWRPSAGIAGLQSPSGLRLGYRFVDDDVNAGLGLPEARLFQNRNSGVEELSGAAYLRLGNYMGLSYIARYDFADEIEGSHFLEQSVVWRLLSRCNCWVLDVGVTDRFDTDEQLLRVQFSLVGLGSVGGRPTYRNYVGVGSLAPFGDAGGRPEPAQDDGGWE